MKSKRLFMLIFLAGLHAAVFSQVTSYQFDPDKINAGWANQMDSLYREDQQPRFELMKLIREAASKESQDSIRSVIQEKDSLNLVFVSRFIDEHGWPTPQDIGFQGVQALFLVIQHADLKTQKRYYPLIRKAENQGNMLSANVAILEDRIAVREGRPQTYGSQGYYDPEKKKTFIYPLADLKNLDELRKARGLGPMKDYKQDWDPTEYESYLPYANELLERSKEANAH